MPGTDESSPSGRAQATLPARGLSVTSLLRPAAFGKAMNRLRTGGYGRLTNLRVAPDRIDASMLTKDGRLRQVQVVPGGAVRVLGTSPTGFAGARTMALKGINRSAPSRLTRSAAGRLKQPASRVDYLVLSEFARRAAVERLLQGRPDLLRRRARPDHPPDQLRGRGRGAFPRLDGMPTQDEIRSALARVIDPELRRSIVELGMVRSIDIADSGDVHVTVSLTTAGCPIRSSFTEAVTREVGTVAGVGAVTVAFDVLSDTEKSALQKTLGRGSMPAGALAQVDQRPVRRLGQGRRRQVDADLEPRGRADARRQVRRDPRRRRLGLLDPAHVRPRQRAPAGLARAQDHPDVRPTA